MLFSKSTALLLSLAAGFASQAVAYPSPGNNIAARYPYNAPALPAPEVFPPLKRDGKKNKNNNDVIKITQVNIETIQQGNNVAIVKQVQTVLIQNSNNNKKKNNKRKDAYKKKNNKNTTVLIVVQQIVVQISDDKGNKVQKLLFAQSEITANKGQKKTDTIMITDASTLIAKIGATGTEGGAAATEVGTAAAASITGTGVVGAANATEAVTLADVAPTWTAIEQDPIQSLLAQAKDLIS